VFDNPFTWLLLPACVALGWALARRVGKLTLEAEALRGEAVAGGLTNLAHDDSDEAIAALTQAVEAEPAAVELRLTLGGLFRKRGEIDRAIRLHESLLASDGLSAAQSARARLELAHDYLKAGVIDRAESLAVSLLDAGIDMGEALELLLDLYEQTRDWQQAIAMAQRWQAVRGRSAAPRIAHYHCELAEAARAGGDLPQAVACAESALSVDPDCVRASILLAGIYEKLGKPTEALRHYRRVPEQDIAYFAEVLTPIRRCAEAAGDKKLFAELLAQAEDVPKVPAAVILAKAQWLAETGGAASTYLAGRLAQRPDWEGLLLWLELSGFSTAAGDSWQAVRTGLHKRLAAQPRYSCTQCGFKPSVLFWQCPSCKGWGTIRPVDVVG
jgi:lipopolysaccharide biosynthesis regulator YciM